MITRSRIVLVILIVCACMGISWRQPYLTEAQDSEITPIFTGFAFQNLWWASDSSILSFAEIDGTTQAVNWYAYEPVSGVLEPSDTWPLAPDLEANEQALLGTAAEASGASESFVFVSPDRNYAVSGEEIIRGRQATVSATLADFEQQDATPLPIMGGGSRIGPDHFHVVWSENSSAFGLAASPLLGYEPQFFY